MFGMSLSEIMIIGVIAIMFLGPEKLPEAMVKIADFFKSFKSTVNEVKESLSHEMQLSNLKAEAEEYKNKIEAQISELELDVKKTADVDEFTKSVTNDVAEINKELTKDTKKKDDDA